MRIDFMIYPLLAQVALAFVLAGSLGLMRLRSALRREVRMSDVALDNRAWPLRARQIGNSYANQFEAPVLFYVVCLLVMLQGEPDRLMNWLAWGFVASRYVHAFIHVTYNRVQHRFYAFAAGLFLLLVMWLRFASPYIAALAG